MSTYVYNPTNNRRDRGGIDGFYMVLLPAIIPNPHFCHFIDLWYPSAPYQLLSWQQEHGSAIVHRSWLPDPCSQWLDVVCFPVANFRPPKKGVVETSCYFISQGFLFVSCCRNLPSTCPFRIRIFQGQEPPTGKVPTDHLSVFIAMIFRQQSGNPSKAMMRNSTYFGKCLNPPIHKSINFTIRSNSAVSNHLLFFRSTLPTQPKMPNMSFLSGWDCKIWQISGPQQFCFRQGNDWETHSSQHVSNINKSG